jgi:hypothetical protein
MLQAVMRTGTRCGARRLSVCGGVAWSGLLHKRSIIAIQSRSPDVLVSWFTELLQSTRLKGGTSK